jgi:hypothetical protein
MQPPSSEPVTDRERVSKPRFIENGSDDRRRRATREDFESNRSAPAEQCFGGLAAPETRRPASSRIAMPQELADCITISIHVRTLLFNRGFDEIAQEGAS